MGAFLTGVSKECSLMRTTSVAFLLNECHGIYRHSQIYSFCFFVCLFVYFFVYQFSPSQAPFSLLSLTCTERTEQPCVSARDFRAATSRNLFNTTAPNIASQGGKMSLNDCYVVSVINGYQHCCMTIKRLLCRTGRRQIKSVVHLHCDK